MAAPKCECCALANGWGLIDNKYALCCKPCVDEGLAELAEYEDVYREVLKCACGKSGPVNYDDGLSTGYYCGGSERCIP